MTGARCRAVLVAEDGSSLRCVNCDPRLPNHSVHEAYEGRRYVSWFSTIEGAASLVSIPKPRRLSALLEVNR